MNKPMLGLVLGGILGAFDGLSAMISEPQLFGLMGAKREQLLGIVIGSTVKGLIAGVAIGWFARKVRSLPLGIGFGFLVGLALAYAVAAIPGENGEHYYWQIMLPGSLVGVIVGYATQRYGRSGAPAVRDPNPGRM